MTSEMWTALVLMLALPLSLGYYVESGCDKWDQHNSDTVCCSKCKPGNRLRSRCGEDPKTLCEPCVNRTYLEDARLNLPPMCLRCKVCTGPMRVKEPCTPIKNAVCECVKGFRCGDDYCSHCVKECGKGEQPAKNRGCEPCPEGTFNDKTHHSCVNWRSGCPFNQKMVANGTKTGDIVCGPADIQELTTRPQPDVHTTKTPADNKDNTAWTSLLGAVICAVLILVFAVTLLITFICKNEQMLKTVPIPEEAAVGWRQTPEQEQCSFCFPQEEHGSSSEVSLVSDNKPFELVV